MAGKPYSQTLQPAFDHDPGNSWTTMVTAGSIPPGMILDNVAAVPTLHGTPTAPGDYFFTVLLNQAGGGGA